MNNQSDETKIAVLTTKVDGLRDDVREVRNMVSDKIATKEYVNDKVNPVKKLVYWMLGLIGTLIAGIFLALVGVLLR